MARLMSWAAGGAGWNAEPMLQSMARADSRGSGRSGGSRGNWAGTAWLVAGTIAVALLSYSLSLQVANERRAMDGVARENRVLAADLKALNAELRVRMRMPQLQRWNDEVLGLVPISAHQYLAAPDGLVDYGDPLPAAPVAAMPKASLAIRDVAPAIVAATPRLIRTSAPAPAAAAPATKAVAAKPRAEAPAPRAKPLPRTILASAPERASSGVERPAQAAPQDLLQQVAMLGNAPPDENH